jgi:Mrp family chromosome partitioning ATPase
VDPASIMGSDIVSRFFAWARENYERIIIDSPPFGLVGDVMTLASMVDGVIIMCCPDRSHFKPLQSASRNLAEAGATVLGVVVNDVDIGGMGGAFTPTAHYGYNKYGKYGYGYGYGYGHGAGSPAAEKEQKAKNAEAAATVIDEE